MSSFKNAQYEPALGKAVPGGSPMEKSDEKLIARLIKENSTLRE